MIKLINTNKENFIRIFKVMIYYFCVSEEEDSDDIQLIILAVLIQLTKNIEFASLLNTPLDFSMNFKTFPLVTGTYADLLIITICHTILKRNEEAKRIYTFNYLCVILNISPFVRNLSKLSAVKMTSLLMLFTNYCFLMSSWYHPMSLLKLMKIFDQIISFNSQENVVMILELWKRRQYVVRIAKLNFEERTINFVVNEQKS